MSLRKISFLGYLIDVIDVPGQTQKNGAWYVDVVNMNKWMGEKLCASVIRECETIKRRFLPEIVVLAKKVIVTFVVQTVVSKVSFFLVFLSLD